MSSPDRDLVMFIDESEGIEEGITLVFKEPYGESPLKEQSGVITLDIQGTNTKDILGYYKRIPKGIIEIKSSYEPKLVEQIMESAGYISLTKAFGATKKLNDIVLMKLYLIASKKFENLENTNPVEH